MHHPQSIIRTDRVSVYVSPNKSPCRARQGDLFGLTLFYCFHYFVILHSMAEVAGSLSCVLPLWVLSRYLEVVPAIHSIFVSFGRVMSVSADFPEGFRAMRYRSLSISLVYAKG